MYPDAYTNYSHIHKLCHIRSQLQNTEETIGHVEIGIIFFLLENPNDACKTFSQFWLAGQHSVKSTASWLVMLENNEKATLNINMPYFLQQAIV